MTTIRYTLAALTISCLSATPGFAQNLSAGAKVGIGFANLGGDFEEVIQASTDLKTGFSVGAFLGIDLTRQFRMQGELQYVQKGAKASQAGIDATFKVNYLELLVPLTFLIPVEGGSIQPRVYAGPSVAFELDCKADLEQSGVSVSVECGSEEFNAPTNSIDFGLVVGGGVDLAAGPGHLTFDVLYNLGLGDIADEDPGDDAVDVNNTNIQILLGYGFRLGG